MKIFEKSKDGGPESRVTGYWLIEAKKYFSVVLLHFADGSREAYHSHAFHALSWVLSGRLTEFLIEGEVNKYEPSLLPVWTPRSRFHKVKSTDDTWVLSFRGPWADTWEEFIPDPDAFIPGSGKFLTLTHGRKVVEES